MDGVHVQGRHGRRVRCAVSVKLNTDVERAEWLQCLQAAAGIDLNPRLTVEEVVVFVAAMADGLYEQYRKRADQ